MVLNFIPPFSTPLPTTRLASQEISSNTKPLYRNRRVSCSSQSAKFQRPYTSVMIVPTGVGAAIGGYAGDALPVARTLASVADCVISHPNVLNAAMLYWPMPNVLYVEGHALDRFAEGLWALQPVHQNKKTPKKAVEESAKLFMESNRELTKFDKMMSKQLEVMFAKLRILANFDGDGRFAYAIKDEVEIRDKKIVEKAKLEARVVTENSKKFDGDEAPQRDDGERGSPCN
ncbi:hypothetical protein GIB67_025657 [Kingdonia uniflora]|uniref:Uncharacterized protein n=1 Tax=Kingdonia uniflora TaxID=39325 RepID=A0A7J7L8Q0_9MAGN|nr:hypothetical protein GIB67_025657 [Kingdonia uniflora]